MRSYFTCFICFSVHVFSIFLHWFLWLHLFFICLYFTRFSLEGHIRYLLWALDFSIIVLLSSLLMNGAWLSLIFLDFMEHICREESKIFWLTLNKDYLIYMIRLESKFDLIHDKNFFHENTYSFYFFWFWFLNFTKSYLKL